AQADQGEIRRNCRPSEEPISQNLWKGSGNSPDLLNSKARVAQQPPRRAEGEQPGMGMVQNPCLAVVELPQQQHQSLRDKGDVWAGEDHGLLLVVELRAEALEKLLRLLQVLDHVQQKQIFEVVHLELRRLIEVLQVHADGVVFLGWLETVDYLHLASLFLQLASNSRRSGADVQHGGAGGHRLQRIGMAARISELQLIVHIALYRRVVSALIQNAGAVSCIS